MRNAIPLVLWHSWKPSHLSVTTNPWLTAYDLLPPKLVIVVRILLGTNNVQLSLVARQERALRMMLDNGQFACNQKRLVFFFFWQVTYSTSLDFFISWHSVRAFTLALAKLFPGSPLKEVILLTHFYSITIYWCTCNYSNIITGGTVRFKSIVFLFRDYLSAHPET